MNHAGELARADPAGAPARRDRHRHRQRPHREFFGSDGGDRRRQGRDLRRAGARRHRDHPVRQPASRPPDRRRATACRRASSPSAWARAPTSAPPMRSAAAAGTMATARGSATRSSASPSPQPGEHMVSERAGRARGGAGGGRRPRRWPRSRWPSWPASRAAAQRHAIAVDGRRGAADRRELQRQSGLDGGDARRCSAPRRSRGAASPCSARCASWAPNPTPSTPRSAEPIAAAERRTARSWSARRWRALAKALGPQPSNMTHVPDAAAAAIAVAAEARPARRRDPGQGLQLARTCRRWSKRWRGSTPDAPADRRTASSSKGC